MISNRTRLTHQLLHPATLIALLALLVATSGTAYAIVITGSDIKDGTVASADIKNGSLTGTDIKDGYLTGTDIKTGGIGSTDLAGTAKGARAVATVWGNAEGCYIISATSRGFIGCTRDGVGDYILTVNPTVSMTNTYPICSRGNNGGINTTYQFSCNAGVAAPATSVAVNTARVIEAGDTAPESYDPSETIPVVVVIP